MSVDFPLNGGLEKLAFDNSFTRDLPADPEQGNFRRQVPGACYSRVLPTPVSSPTLIGWSPEVATLLDLDPVPTHADLMARVFSGNLVLPGMDPFAMCYGGHQFGSWAGQLGDGRAINLGEVVNRSGQRHVLQLKGAGRTPYSRTADGLAVLRSSIREFLCSEAMHHLGVPTTRALSLVLTGEQVMRDMFYDGNPGYEPGAIVCRVAPSFTRFGNFHILAARGEIEILRQLADHTIRVDFPGLGEPGPDSYARWFQTVCRTTADMIVHWMRVGFVHGVMNTDNMTISGETIDYGPCAFIDAHDPATVFSSIDHGGRYAYGNQPVIAQWNLARLAEAPDLAAGLRMLLQSSIAEQPVHKMKLWLEIGAEAARNLGMARIFSECDGAIHGAILNSLRRAEAEGRITPTIPVERIVEMMGIIADGLIWRRAIAPQFDANQASDDIVALIGALVGAPNQTTFVHDEAAQ